MITTRACTMIKVNSHKQRFDGTICSQATRWRCGASDNFRQNKCAQGQAYCYDMYSFDHADPYVRKPSADYDRDGYLTDMVAALEDGDQPLLFFYTLTPNNVRLLVGLYVVDSMMQAASGFTDEYHIRPARGQAIFFDDPELTNDFLYRHSIGTEFYVRSIAEAYVPTALNEILGQQRRLLLECTERADLHEKAARLEENIAQLTAIILALGHQPEPGHDDEEGERSVAPASGSVARAAGGVGRAAASGQATRQPVEPAGGQAGTAAPKVAAMLRPELVTEMEQVTEAVLGYARGQGLYYPKELIQRYHLSLMAKPFVILAGVSGGGKTQLAMAYAKAIGAKLAVISVGPNWTSNESLLGAYDVLSHRFVPTEFTRFLVEAEQDYQAAVASGAEPTRFCVVLDEMNLSHVEYYFSDLLSKMELTGAERQIRLHDYEDATFPKSVAIPPNLSITGTVNVDETTHRFSPKVLDRANFIRLDEINLQEMLSLIASWEPAIYHKEQAREVTGYLRGINTVLLTSQQHFGYRTAREIILWVDRATCSGAFSLAAALDLQILQKVLVKVQGSKFNPTERRMIQELVMFFEDTIDAGTQQPLFPLSTAQIKRMQAELNEEEYTFGQQ